MTGRLDTIVVLDHPKYEVNVGTAMRSAVAFGADVVILVGRRYEREPGDVFHAQKFLDVLPVPSWERALELIGDIPIVVLERLPAAMRLRTLEHPPRAAYVFGPEDGSVHPDVVAFARYRVQIPHAQSENAAWGCLNLATSIGIVLYDRFCRSGASDLRRSV
jgi:tRNA(Leu) C34 or U34 (ribose-2'-O)-methylase TrmL